MPETGKEIHCDLVHHHSEPDGGSDALCLSCFLAVVSAESQASLDSVEELHPCHGKKPPQSAGHSSLGNMQYFRKLVFADNNVFSSECRHCGIVLGYSSHPDTLEIVESIHRCAGLVELVERRHKLA